jgi:hypothetical protein
VKYCSGEHIGIKCEREQGEVEASEPKMQEYSKVYRLGEFELRVLLKARQGINITEEQQEELSNKLKRPLKELEEEPKLCKRKAKLDEDD